MLAVHGEPQRGLLSNGYASLRDAVRAEFFDPCEPPMEVGSLTFHAKQTRPRERPAQAQGAHHFAYSFAYSFASQHANGATMHMKLAFDTFAKLIPILSTYGFVAVRIKGRAGSICEALLILRGCRIDQRRTDGFR
jgi:hypothetical protein